MVQLAPVSLFMFLKAYRLRHLHYDSTDSRAVSADIDREVDKTTTDTVARTSLNKSFNEQNNGYVRALQFLILFFAVLCKTTTWTDQTLRCLENVNHDG